MKKIFAVALTMMIGVSATAGQGTVSWKSTGRSLNDAPSPRAASQTFRQVPSKARIYGNRFVTGETATMPSVAPVPRAKAETGAASGRKAQALLIYSESKGASNCIIELPIAAGAVSSFDVVADRIPPLPYKSYGEYIVNAVAYGNEFVASTFCDMFYSQTNTVYTVADWGKKTAYDYRAADLEATALAYNPENGQVYGVFQGTNPTTKDEAWFFGKWSDPGSYTRPEFISWLDPEKTWFGMAISPKGVIYLIDSDCNLLTIDSRTGETTLIGSTGLQNKYKTSACYDDENDRILFATSLDQGSSFNAIDPGTGRATMLYTMPDGEQITGLFIPEAKPADKAPSPAANLKADFELGSLAGFITFDVPATYSDGTAASGKVSYEVRIDGDRVSDGTASFGTTVKAPVTLTESADALVTVKLSNDASSAPLTRANLFCGTPTPRNPYFTSPLTYDSDSKSFRLSWIPNGQISGMNGGVIVNDDLSYELVRYPDGKVITTGKGATSMSDPYEFPDDSFRIIYYTLRAVYYGSKSTAATTEALSFGIITPPFDEPTLSGASEAAYTWLDTASDNYGWSYIGAVSEQTDRHGWMYHGTSGSSTPMDSYLVMKGMRLQKGKVYTLTFATACTNTSWRNERLAVYLGDALTETGLRKQTLIEPTLIYNRREENGERRSCNFSVDKDGIYYLSFHHCSDPNMRYLYIGDISVSAPIDGSVPQEITGLNVKAAPGGALSATVSFGLPKKSVDGNALTEPVKIRILRGDELIADVAPQGTTYSYTDTKAVNGICTYTVIPYNSKGEGLKASANAFVGVGKPGNPSPWAWYGDDDGTARLVWEPSTRDEFGTLLTSSNVRYEIQRVTTVGGKTEQKVIADNVTDTEYIDRFCAPDAEPTPVSYWVRAVTDGGNSQWTGTRKVCLGKPATASWSESFGNATAGYRWFNIGENVSWGCVNDAVYDDAKSVDADNGFMMCVASRANSASVLYSEPVYIPADMASPEFSFYFLNQDKYQGVPVKNFVELVVLDEEGQHHLKKEVCDGPWGWERMSLDMEKYKGKKVQVGVYVECIDRPSVLLDAFRIATRLENDIDMVTLRGPEEIEAGMDITLTASFENRGSKDIPAGYTVELYRGNVKIDEAEGPALASDKTASLNFKVATNPTQDDVLDFKAVVVFNDDDNKANNTSNALSIELIKNQGYPEPRNLVGDTETGGIALQWEAPDMSKTPRKTYTETFEQFESFAKSIPGWTIVDGDKGIVAPVSSYIQTPDTWGSPFGFFVQDNTTAPFSEFEEFTPYSGSKYMASQFVTDKDGNDMQNDDWLISPELSGDRQTASFMGKSISPSWLESFEVYYSMEGTDIADFVLIGGVSQAPSQWINYSADIPAGARYFAIRCNSYACLQFMVDDVTLRLKSCDPIELTLQGYNIYRDGVKVNDAPVSALSFTDNDAPAGDHTYKVTAVYREGESLPSNPASAYAAISAAPADAVNVYGGRGFISVTGAQGLDATVCNVGGMTIFDGSIADDGRIWVSPGIYVVTVAGKSYKVAVR